MRERQAATIVLVILCVSLASCSQQSESLRSAVQTGGFASPDDLLEHVQSILSDTPPRITEFFALVHCENELEQFYDSLSRDLFIPMGELNQVWHERFGELFMPAAAKILPHQSMQLANVDGTRASVNCLTSEGESHILKLVQVADQWLISAATWLPEDKSAIPSVEDRRVHAEFASSFADRIRRFTERLRAGEFESAEEANAAYESHT